MEARSWNLVADIGGTNARFAATTHSAREFFYTRNYSVADFREFTHTVEEFLREISADGQWNPLPETACLALACPITGDVVRFTNSPWQVDRNALSTLCGRAPVVLINDFESVGYAVTELDDSDYFQLGEGLAVPNSPVAVLGPGTGLGVCTVIPAPGGSVVIEGEGGHVDFAPLDDLEIDILKILIQRFGHVSVERLLSGPGIVNIYQALCSLHGENPGYEDPARITESAVADRDIRARQTLEIFCRVLGSVAGNLALTLGARGGVYIAGGIVPRIVDFVATSDFIERFRQKGRYQQYLGSIPVRIITRENLGLAGAVKRLNGVESQ